MRIQLVRDVLDNELIDVNDQHAGRVDGIVLEVRDDGALRVAFVEVGPVTRARRLNRRLGEWVARLDARFGEGRGRAIRIPFTRVSPAAPVLRLDLAAERTAIYAVEQWLRRVIVRRIPGA